MGGPAYIDGEVYDVLDNFYKCKFLYKNYLWSSSEQAYQAMKFLDKDHINRIHQESDIGVIYYLGQDKYAKKTKEWTDDPCKEKLRLMYEINKAKFSQNRDLYNILISSKKEIEYRGDRFWGKKGKNSLNWGGKILMKIRYEFFCDEEEKFKLNNL